MTPLSSLSRADIDAILDHYQGADHDPWCLPASMRFAPKANVLAMVCVSGGNLPTAASVLKSLMRIASMQHAQVWVQMFERALVEGFQPATDVLLNRLATPGGLGSQGGGGTDLTPCLNQALMNVPLPNGRLPDHLVLAFNGVASGISMPTVQGRVVPTSLLLPPGTSASDARSTRSFWGKHIPVVQLQDDLLSLLDNALEGVALRHALREIVPASPAVPRRRF